MTRYEHIVFMQGEEAEEPLRILDEQGKRAAINFLLQWDNEPGLLCDEPAHGSGDNTYRYAGLLLTWNARLDYIGLERIRKGT